MINSASHQERGSMDYENMVMLVEAYEGFLELQKLIDAITGEKALYTFEDGVLEN